MSTRVGRGVWAFASVVDRLPWTCWPDLVTWALDLTHWRKPLDPADAWHRLLPRSAQLLTEIIGYDGTSRCREDALRCGSCYCAKFQSEEFQREHVPAHCKPGILVKTDGAR